ncbi:uncharacterized protein CMU_030900 [Cryptosporidium muris RN66]|uniref:Uncharacterized protein n=1 Tax=Cryptosporidium muris (strain RN66) TaxID=441375 RepID=B6AIA8_CRYMR|nr:uncharacterized protein CMU_030900 [Cryptosporidium muris RN66]EEA07949.1 hypothetical protein, conserved [Cryptosporidium muris RN66]|eukprot:XP_002142298.1 hypothetical protein [Cryptosporidium muris RN66]
MDYIKNLINLCLKEILRLENLTWDIMEGINIDNVRFNSSGINAKFDEHEIPIKLESGGITSMTITYSPIEGICKFIVKEMVMEIKPKVLSTMGKKIQQGLASIILDEDPVEYIDSSSYIRDIPLSLLSGIRRCDYQIVSPNIIPEPPKIVKPAIKIKIHSKSQSPPSFYPPLYTSSFYIPEQFKHPYKYSNTSYSTILPNNYKAYVDLSNISLKRGWGTSII